MNKFLKFLSGKKGVIGGIVLTLVGYAAAKGWITELEVGLVGSLITILSGGASYATKKMYETK